MATFPWGALITSVTSEQSTCFRTGGYLISHHSLCSVSLCVCVWLKPWWKVPDSLITSQTVLRCSVVWMWGGRPDQICPPSFSSDTPQGWSFELPYFPGSVAPRRGQWDWQRPPGKHRESFICSSCSGRHIRGLPPSFRRRLSMADGFPRICFIKFCVADQGRYISSQLSLIEADLILCLENWSVVSSVTFHYMLFFGYRVGLEKLNIKN